jgi:hypothetical protein
MYVFVFKKIMWTDEEELDLRKLLEIGAWIGQFWRRKFNFLSNLQK